MVQILKILKTFFIFICLDHNQLFWLYKSLHQKVKKATYSDGIFFPSLTGAGRGGASAMEAAPQTDRYQHPILSLNSGQFSPPTCTCHLCDCRVGRPRGSHCGGGHHPLRLSGPAELEGETRRDVTASEPAQRHLLLRPHQDSGKIEPQQTHQPPAGEKMCLMLTTSVLS